MFNVFFLRSQEHVNEIDFDYLEYARQRFQAYWQRNVKDLKLYWNHNRMAIIVSNKKLYYNCLLVVSVSEWMFWNAYELHLQGILLQRYTFPSFVQWEYLILFWLLSPLFTSTWRSNFVFFFFLYDSMIIDEIIHYQSITLQKYLDE